MTTYYLNHTFITTRCEECDMTFTKALLYGLDCDSPKDSTSTD